MKINTQTSGPERSLDTCRHPLITTVKTLTNRGLGSRGLFSPSAYFNREDSQHFLPGISRGGKPHV